MSVEVWYDEGVRCILYSTDMIIGVMWVRLWVGAVMGGCGYGWVRMLYGAHVSVCIAWKWCVTYALNSI